MIVGLGSCLHILETISGLFSMEWNTCPVPSGQVHTVYCSSHSNKNQKAVLFVISIAPPAKQQMSEHVVE